MKEQSLSDVIIANGLTHSYGEGELKNEILHQLDFKVLAKEVTLLVGPSGSGKSTLLTLIGALRSVETGSLHVLGRQLYGASENELMAIRRRIGFIFQSHNLVASLTVLQNVQLLLQLAEPDPKLRQDRAKAMLDAVGLSERLHHFPDELSGGQRQRVAIARALAPEPDLVLADEPTASLDSKSGQDVVELLGDL
ncbi:ATP-binding cassette domain-containing protein, partial [Synechococcus sp. AH-551-J03]|nr:ATP-binding cassette domain-containing protein [Synechococcus sp. AH-551-J03]